MLSYSKQSISRKDIEKVVKTLKSDYITQGKKLKNLKANYQITLEQKNVF